MKSKDTAMTKYLYLASISFIFMAAVMSNGENLIKNPSFEEIDDGKPIHWQQDTWRGKAEFEVSDQGRNGGKCLLLSSQGGADAASFTIAEVEPFSTYKLSGWIKTENVKPTTGVGAAFNIHNIQQIKMKPVKGTSDWQFIEATFETGERNALQINCLFGGWGIATGKAWFDDIKLEFVSKMDMKSSISIDSSKIYEPISKYIYGQFIEHMGRCIYGGIWAEMLEDRKFYYEPGSQHSPWQITGSKEAVVVSTEVLYSGNHTLVFDLDGEKQCAVIQGKLGVVKDKKYTGRVVFAGDKSALPIEVSLIASDNQSQTITINKIESDYIKVPIEFISPLSTDEAKLKIQAKGKGKFKLATASLMPADNVKGMRADTLELLKQLDAPIYRWPGGNFVSGYNWRDGIGDPDKRPTFKNPAWSGLEYNDFGLDEFIMFCREIGTEPLITVNTGFGDAFSAGQEVEYANSSTDTAMGSWRAENGNKEPYDVRWWCVGNEMWGKWQLGNMKLPHYVLKHNRCSEAMWKIDHTIKLVGCGDMGAWSIGMLKDCANHMQLLSEHFYCGEDKASVVNHARQMYHGVISRVKAHREYRKTIPAIKNKDIDIALDEWNYWYGPHLFGELGTRYFMKDALGVAVGLNEMIRNSDIVFMANYAQTVNVIGAIKTNKTAAAFATTAFPLIIYRKHFGKYPVEISGSTGLLDVVAALTEDKKALTIAVVNSTSKTSELEIDFKNMNISGKATLWQVRHDDPMAYNEPGRQDSVKISEQKVNGISNKLTMPGYSINLYRLELK